MMNGYSYITFEQRCEIERLYNAGTRTVDIAAHLGRSVAAIYDELKRGCDGDRNDKLQRKYSAELSQSVFQHNIEKRGKRRTDAEK